MICLDSDIVIDYLKGRPRAVKAIEECDSAIATTDITIFEVLVGIFDKRDIPKKELEVAQAFFQAIEILPSTGKWAEIAAEISGELARRSAVIDDADTMIAGIMKENGCSEILTGNSKHFGRIPGIIVRGY